MVANEIRSNGNQICPQIVNSAHEQQALTVRIFKCREKGEMKKKNN